MQPFIRMVQQLKQSAGQILSKVYPAKKCVTRKFQFIVLLHVNLHETTKVESSKIKP